MRLGHDFHQLDTTLLPKLASQSDWREVVADQKQVKDINKLI